VNASLQQDDAAVLHASAASHILRICKQPFGPVDAGTLNDMVAAFPQPAEAVRLMGLPIGNLPILFVDMGVKDLADIMGQFLNDGSAPFPVFYMPLDRMEHWARDPVAVTFLEFLHRAGLDIQLTVGGSTTWLRGHWVILCDMRIRFLAGVSEVEVQSLKLLPP
jgi:hypothetical protein